MSREQSKFTLGEQIVKQPIQGQFVIYWAAGQGQQMSNSSKFGLEMQVQQSSLCEYNEVIYNPNMAQGQIQAGL